MGYSHNHYVIDIDECEEELDGCQQNCVNKDGYYYCSCYSGYTVNLINLRKCDGILFHTTIIWVYLF